MMMRLTWVVVIVLILGAGCVSSSTGGLEVALAEGGVQAAIRVDDRQFKRLINVENAIARRAASGFLEANVVTRNRTRNDLPIQYKFEWFDKDGMAVQPGGRPWEQTTISWNGPKHRWMRMVNLITRILALSISSCSTMT